MTTYCQASDPEVGSGVVVESDVVTLVFNFVFHIVGSCVDVTLRVIAPYADIVKYLKTIRQESGSP